MSTTRRVIDSLLGRRNGQHWTRRPDEGDHLPFTHPEHTERIGAIVLAP